MRPDPLENLLSDEPEDEGGIVTPIGHNYALTEEGTGALAEKSLQEKIDGTWYNIPFPNMPLMTFARALVPGAVLGICGGSKAGKSFLVLEWVWRWALDNVRVSFLALESGRRFHCDRLVAQMCGIGDMLDPEWLKIPENRDTVLAAVAKWRDCIHYVAPMVQQMADNQPQTVSNVLKWMEREFRGSAAHGGRPAQIVVVDPVTAISPDRGQRFADHVGFILEADRLARRTNGRVILVTHPIRQKGSGRIMAPSIDNISNGECYGRFCSAVGWLDRAAKVPEQCSRCDENGMIEERCGLILTKRQCPTCGGKKTLGRARSNRKFHWLVTRNAPKPDNIDMRFCGATLTHSEVLPEANA